MRVVIDTNVFVSSFLSPQGNPRKIIDLWRHGEISLCISQSIVEEYLKILARLGVDKKSMDDLLSLFAKEAHVFFVVNTPDLNIIDNDPDDNKFIECAVALNAEYIISGDHHLLDIKNYLNIQIVSPSNFLKKV